MDLLEPLAPFIVVGSLLHGSVAVAIGLAAERRGSSGLLWFALSVFVTPVLALILLLILTPRAGRAGGGSQVGSIRSRANG